MCDNKVRANATSTNPNFAEVEHIAQLRHLFNVLHLPLALVAISSQLNNMHNNEFNTMIAINCTLV
jgi:hypothetical protein